MKLLRLLFAFSLCSVILASRSSALQAAPAPPPLISTAEIMTPDQLRPGMTGYGKTVFRGTTPVTFNITIIGVMRRIEFDADMILIRVTSGPVATRNWGIIAGMSGSPIYVKGKLIGALAFAWPFSKEPIAGVTPIRQMAENYSPGSITSARPLASARAGDFFGGDTLYASHGPLRIGGRMISRAQVFGRSAEAVAPDSHTLALTPIATPVLVNGLSGRSLRALQQVLEPHGLLAMAGGGKAPVKLPAAPIPGGSIGVQLVGGDIDMVAVGTVTYVNKNRILAFGHPFMGTGPIDLPMVNAYVHGILPTLDDSFKLASSGNEVIGRWTEDRTWAIGGVLGQKPQTFPGAFVVRDAERGLRKNYSVFFGRDRRLTPMLAAVAADSAISSVAPEGEGTLTAKLEISAKGLPTITRSNVYTRPIGRAGDFLSFLFSAGGASSPSGELESFLSALEENSFGPVVPQRISMEVDWKKARLAADIEQVSARVKRVRPGDKIPIEVLIQPWNKPRETRMVEVEVPLNAPPGRLQVGIAGGFSAQSVKGRLQISDPTPTTLAQQLEIMARQEKNDELLVEVGLDTSGFEARGSQLFNLPPAFTDVVQAANVTGVRVIRDHIGRTLPLPYVLSGGEVLSFMVETDEKEKAGRGPAVSGPGLELGMPSGLLKELLSSESGTEAMRLLPRDLPPDAAAEPEKPDETTAEDAPPEMPSLEELDALESQEPESVSADKTAEKPKGKSLLRSPVIWKDTAEKDFAAGKVFGVAVNSSGEVDLAPAAATLYSAKQGLLWSQAADTKGNLYVASWLQGQVRRISPDGSSQVVLEVDSPAVTALACDASGALYAAVAPSGAIYKVSAEGKRVEFAKLPVPYVWALLADGDKGLLAATGPEGKLFRVSPEGKTEAVFQAPDRHIISLISGPNGAAYFATYPKGKIYRLQGGKVAPFYETPPTVSALSLALDGAGNLYVGTTPSAQIICIDTQGKAKLLYKSPERHIFALWPAADGSIYAATGPRARIYQVFPDGRAAVVWEAKTGSVVALTENAGRLSASLADAGSILRLNLTAAAEGTFVSSVRDAGAPSRWGRITWQENRPEGSAVTLQTRSGNTAYPDSAWSDWSPAYSQAAGEPVSSPPARYLQYRALLKSNSAGKPSVRQVEVFYLPRNRAPELKLLAPEQGPIWSGKQNIKWSATDPDKDTLSYQVFYSSDQGKSWTEIKEAVKKEVEKKAPEKEEPAKEKGKTESKSAVAAEAEKKPEKPAETTPIPEPNPVDLKKVIAVEQKTAETEKPATEKEKEPEKEAAKEAPPTNATSMSWDTTKAADGLYLIKVIASDRGPNPDDPLGDERISEPFRVDNTPPVVVLNKKEVGPPPARVTATDGGTYVASAEYRVDKGDWKGALCADGIYDDPEEEILIPGADLPKGEHTLQVRVRDAAGNETTDEVKYKKS